MFLKKDQIKKVLDIVAGSHPADKVLLDMKDFFKTEFSLEIIDYICDRANRGAFQGSLRVRFVVWDVSEKRNSRYDFDNDMTIEERIKHKFSEVCKEHQLNEQYSDPLNYYVVITDLRSDLACHLIENKQKTLTSILETYPEVKKYNFAFGEVQVFYTEDKDIEIYRANGLSQEIVSKIQQSVGSITGLENKNIIGVVFSSIQTFNEKYFGDDYAVYMNGLDGDRMF